jgi:hypothetical protein
MIDRSNSEDAEHLEHGTTGRRGRVEGLLRQIEIASNGALGADRTVTADLPKGL